MSRFPIGPFEPEHNLSSERRLALIEELEIVPSKLRATIEGWTDAQLDTPYREGGWTVRQVVHHLADAHMNWYVRTKLAVTENEPLVTPFDEVRWAELEDARTGPVEPSLLLLEALSLRWAALFRTLAGDQWSRKMIHPERGVFTLETTLAMHVWHGLHHTAQIAQLAPRLPS